MPYMDIVWRSFRISWNHKYLWLIALFSGEGGGASFNSSYSSGQPSGGRPDFSTVQEQVTTWISDHIGLIVVVVIAWLLLIIALFILAAVCEGATVRASAEHDAERPFRLGLAWRAGVNRMWAIVRFRLLLIALLLPLWLMFVAFLLAVAIAIANRNASAIPGLFLSALSLTLIAFTYGLYIFFLDRLGSRALVLEQLGARASIARAHRLLVKRIGRTLLVWLLSIAVGLVVGILFACAFAIVIIPFAIAGGIAFATHAAVFWPLAILAVIIVLPISLVVGGFLAAQGSTYWTLAFRRLDLDYQPAPPPQAAS
jgi:hypothetical protein